MSRALSCLVSAQRDEGERLERVERETAGTVERFRLLLPFAPVERPSGLRLLKAAFCHRQCVVEIALVGVNLVEAIVDGQLGGCGRKGLAEQLVSPLLVTAIGATPS
jgi:hypothetical protein